MIDSGHEIVNVSKNIETADPQNDDNDQDQGTSSAPNDGNTTFVNATQLYRDVGIQNDDDIFSDFYTVLETFY